MRQYIRRKNPKLHQYIFAILVKRIAKKLSITPTVFGGSEERVHVGKDVSLGNAILNVSSGHIFIGDFTFFGHCSCALTGTHDYRLFGKRRQEYPDNGRDIVIGAGVWIATNVTILGPCTIGDNAVIGAGSLLLPGTYAGNALYAGAPATLIREISLKAI